MYIYIYTKYTCIYIYTKYTCIHVGLVCVTSPGDQVDTENTTYRVEDPTFAYSVMILRQLSYCKLRPVPLTAICCIGIYHCMVCIYIHISIYIVWGPWISVPGQPTIMNIWSHAITLHHYTGRGRGGYKTTGVSNWEVKMILLQAKGTQHVPDSGGISNQKIFKPDLPSLVRGGFAWIGHSCADQLLKKKALPTDQGYQPEYMTTGSPLGTYTNLVDSPVLHCLQAGVIFFT